MNGRHSRAAFCQYLVVTTLLLTMGSPSLQVASALRSAADGSSSSKSFEVSFERLLQSPILSEAFSSSTFNYNAAYVPHVGRAGDGSDSLPRDCLAVRIQNYTTTVGGGARTVPSRRYRHHHHMAGGGGGSSAAHTRDDGASASVGVGYIGPSSIAIMCESGFLYPFAAGGGAGGGDGGDPWVVLEPSQAAYQNLGTEDPRVVYVPHAIETDVLRQRRSAAAAGGPPLSSPPPPAAGAGKVPTGGAVRDGDKGGTLLMFYSAVTNHTADGHVTAMLALAVCHLEFDPQCRQWELRGPILPDRGWSKSGALLVRPSNSGASTRRTSSPLVHYLLFGDTDIFVAATTDFLTYTDLNQTLLSTRSASEGYFDSNLVESGPPPELLGDGASFIFLYNSARIADIPNPDPNWKLQYNLGYAVLGLADGEGAMGGLPTVLQRSDSPILSPELGWEQCNNASRVPGLTADVVFVEGMKRLGGGMGAQGRGGVRSASSALPSRTTAVDMFLVYYQGADARMGLGLLTVVTSTDPQL